MVVDKERTAVVGYEPAVPNLYFCEEFIVLYGMIMQEFALKPSAKASIRAVLFCLLCGILMPAAAGADIDIEGIMGEPITFHGFSYVGDSVYLFLTGPGLPENGVTLTDISQRADQGHFTVVDVDDNQEWTYTWRTSRIDSEIDDGTYTVHVTNEPRDLSQLGDERRYKTISVYLKDSGISKVSISAQHAYPRNTADSVTTPGTALPVTLTSVTPPATMLSLVETVLITPDQTTVPATRAGTGSTVAVTALLCCVCLVSFLKARH